jgi:hypothetical protein
VKTKAAAVQVKAVAAQSTVKHPVTVSLVQQPGNPTTSTQATFAWATTGSVSTTTCSINGSTWTTCSSGVNYAGLSTGVNAFSVKVHSSTSSAQASAQWSINAAPSTSGSGGSGGATTSSVANTFGQGMFGIAAGSTLQNESSTPSVMDQDLSNDRSAGARWVRIDINWAQIQQAGPTSYYWTAIDDAVAQAEADGLNVLGTIVFTPSWARPAGASATYGPDPATYARFAGIAVAHYAAMGVHDYELWNEPNISGFWTPAPSPAAYTALLKAAYPAIKAADPTATVISGGLSPAATDGTNYTPPDFLAGIYANGGQGYFDAVANHPYCWPAYPGDPDNWSAWYQMYGTSTSLRSLMIAHGDGGKKIWGTEFGAPTNGPAGSSYVSQAVQADMISRAFALWSTYSWAGPLFIYDGRDLGTSTDTIENFFGISNSDFSPKPSYYAYQSAAAAF